jgi:hypothetical protein
VDYFSTLAYLPSIAAEAAGVWAPVTAAGVVIVTFLLALPVYWYIVGRSPDGRGAAGIMEDSMPGWRGKLVVLTLLGFAAADFVITRSLSLADAAVHLIHNPHGQQLLEHLHTASLKTEHGLWQPLELALHHLANPQVIITLGLSITSFALWQLLKRDITPRVLSVTAAAVTCYLALAAIIIGTAAAYIASHPAIWQNWQNAVIAASAQPSESAPQSATAWLLAWLQIGLWTFPQMALGLSGFEMIMNVVPRVSGGEGDAIAVQRGRIQNTRKLMLAAATLMAVYLVSAVTVTTLLIPHDELLPGGNAAHRALAYLAHGSPLATGGDAAISSIFGETFGDIFDLASAFILCLAGVSVTMGLQNLVPHYLHRLGMDGHWAGKSGIIMHVLNVIIIAITVVFHASVSLQQLAYSTSVLVLLTAASLAAAKSLRSRLLPLPPGEGRGESVLIRPHFFIRFIFVLIFATAGAFFLLMTGLTVVRNYSGLVIALLFVLAIVVSSFVSRWIRCTELRFEGFEIAEELTRQRWNELRHSGAKILVPHRPGLVSLGEKCSALQRDYRLDPMTPILFVEVTMGDPSNFYQKPLMKIQRDGQHEVIRLDRCVSVAHVLAALCLELNNENSPRPEILFGWSHESPIAANLNFLLLGEGNVPWMVKELVRKAIPDPAKQPRIRIG